MDRPSAEDLAAASTSSGRGRSSIQVEDDHLPISRHLRSAGSPTPIQPIVINNNENIISNEHNYAINDNSIPNDHNYAAEPPNIFNEHDYARPDTPPTPIHPETFRDHTYSSLIVPQIHEFNEDEQRLYSENITNPPILSQEITERYIRQVSNFAFRYACLDVNYNIYNTDFLNSLGDYQIDILQLFDLILNEINHQLRIVRRFKLNLGLHVVYTNPNYDDGQNPTIQTQPLDPEVSVFIWLSAREFDIGTDVSSVINEMLEEFTQRVSSTEKGPSGLSYKYYLSVSFSFNVFSHQFGSHSDNFFNLPSCINIKAFIAPKTNVDAKSPCFVNAIKDHFNHHEISLRNINFSDIKTKTTFLDITKFEAKHTRIQIHVLAPEFQDDDETILDHYSAIYKSKNPYSESNIQIILMLYREHFYCVENMAKLVQKPTTNRKNLRERNYQTHFCFNCLSSFARFSRLEKHLTICDSKNTIVASFPKKTLEFSDYSATVSPPYVIFYDIEVIKISIPLEYIFLRSRNIFLVRIFFFRYEAGFFLFTILFFFFLKTGFY